MQFIIYTFFLKIYEILHYKDWNETAMITIQAFFKKTYATLCNEILKILFKSGVIQRIVTYRNLEVNQNNRWYKPATAQDGR